MSPASILGLGFLLGLRHACDADHVAAVAAIVARHKRVRTAWLLGAAWGLGHSLTVLAVGGGVVLFRVAIPERLALGMEFTVGLMLVLLGGLSLAGRLGGGVTAHAHGHEHSGEHAHGGDGGHSHAHLHAPPPGAIAAALREAGGAPIIRALLIGLVHGLAGSAGIALLVLAAIPRAGMGFTYLALFAAGTLAGMLLLSALMGLSLTRLARWWGPGERAMGLATGLFSIAIGLRLAYAAGSLGGLF